MVGWLHRGWWRLCSPTARFRYSLLAASAVAGFYLLAFSSSGYDAFYQQTLSSLKPLILQDEDQEPTSTAEKHERRFNVYSEGCIIPKLRPFNGRVKEYIKWPRFISKCPMHNHPLLSFNASHIWLNKHNYIYYGVGGMENHVACCYRSFFRPRSVYDIDAKNIDDRTEYKECQPFWDTIVVVDEFVRVDCHFNFTHVLDVQYFAFAFRKPARVSSSKEIKENVLTDSSYSILILGIDTVSRMNFYRTMPKTLKYLQSNGAVELLGYNKVGDNTFPNVIAMLLGISASELKTTCWPQEDKTFDNCPFVWNIFKRKGYITAFGEDDSDLGTFNYLKNGFILTPTDYYLHPFMYEAKRIRITKLFMSRSCMGNRYFYKVLLDYVESLVTAIQPSQLFGFFWESTMTHDHLNAPVEIDASYVKLLEKINYLNNTIVFLVSDHGIRWGGIRQTKQGRLEERLPFMYILTPKSFRERYKHAYGNLQLNVQRLTTPFDIHATLNDLADMSSISNSRIKIRSKESYSSKRGISLFLPIPRNRTCHSAGIEDHWCTCHSERKVEVTNTKVQEAASYIVSQINNFLLAKQDCAKLTLSKVIEAIEMTIVASELKPIWGEFLIVVQTSPGDGVFEATVYNKSDHRNFELSISGTISRLNLYGNQSYCVHGAKLKLYCYCKKQRQ